MCMLLNAKENAAEFFVAAGLNDFVNLGMLPIGQAGMEEVQIPGIILFCNGH